MHAVLALLVPLMSLLGGGDRPGGNPAPLRPGSSALLVVDTACQTGMQPDALAGARLLESSLAAVGFQVEVLTGLGKDGLVSALNRFATDTLRPGGVALVYFDGRTTRLEGAECLLPCDTPVHTGGEARSHCVPVRFLMEVVDGSKARAKVLILDTVEEAQGGDEGEDASRGPRIGVPGVSSEGWFVASATAGAPGAANRPGVRPLAAVLAVQMQTPGIEIHALFQQVRTVVHRLTEGRHEVRTASTLTEDFLFLPADAPLPPKQNREPLVVLVNLGFKDEVTDGYTKITQVLADLAPGFQVKVVHWTRFSVDTLSSLEPSALVLGPQGTPWWEYEEEALKPAKDAVLGFDGPVLGICGGHQFLSLASGGNVAPMRCEKSHRGYKGCFRERGFLLVRLLQQDPLFEGVGSRATFWENHVEEVKEVPVGFDLLASSDSCRVQAIRQRGSLRYGLQFHPENYDDAHPDGKRLLLNFLRMAGVQTAPEANPTGP
jgi:GMP synthase (glutamine-hydrolysing)